MQEVSGSIPLGSTSLRCAAVKTATAKLRSDKAGLWTAQLRLGKPRTSPSREFPNCFRIRFLTRCAVACYSALGTVGNPVVLERKKPLQRRTGIGPGKKGLKRSGFKKTGPQKTGASAAEAPAPADPLKIAAARKLWPLLQNQEIGGLRFLARQLAGPYLVDFLCPDAKLVLEITPDRDGEEARRQDLRALGYRILLLDAQKILDDPQSALAVLAGRFTLRVISRNC